MKRKLLSAFLIAAVFTVSGCSLKTGGASEKSEKKGSYVDDLEDGVYYVRHANNKCEPVYLGYATFEPGETTTSPDVNRIAWFTEDFKEIPTLYDGDSLILYTNKELDEEFNFERFQDLGYTIGIRGLERTPSGRYRISTDKDDQTTYPKGDTDVLLDLNNENVIVESIGVTQLRSPGKGSDGKDIKDPMFSDFGTILGLQKGNSYNVKVYDGTEGHDYIWKADVRILGSFEVEVYNNFEFETDSLIRIDIPSSYHSGYYMINGVGIFRLVRGADEISDDMDFNVPNFTAAPEEEEESRPTTYLGNISETGGNNEEYAEETDQPVSYEDYMMDVNESTFDLSAPGVVSLSITIIGELETTDPISAALLTPAGEKLQLSKSGNRFQIVFPAEELGMGTYTIQITGLNGRQADVDISYVDEG